MSYFIYYEPNNGQIRGIAYDTSPSLEEFPKFKIEDDIGTQFINGELSLRDYIAGKIGDVDKRILKKRIVQSNRSTEDGLLNIPEKDTGILLVVIYKDKIQFKIDQKWLNDQTQEELDDWMKYFKTMSFYVTEKNNPYALLDTFVINSEELFKLGTEEFNVSFESISIWTLKVFAEYGMKYE